MSVPVIERIAVNIQEAIDAITVENGFNQTLTAIRPRRLDFAGILLNDGKVFVWQGDERPVGEPANLASEWEVDFDIGAIVIDSDDETDSIDTRLNQVASDIEKKLLADPQRGGYAIDTRVGGRTKIDTEETTGKTVTITVHYRTRYDDPYTQI